MGSSRDRNTRPRGLQAFGRQESPYNLFNAAVRASSYLGRHGFLYGDVLCSLKLQTHRGSQRSVSPYHFGVLICYPISGVLCWPTAVLFVCRQGKVFHWHLWAVERFLFLMLSRGVLRAAEGLGILKPDGYQASVKVSLAAKWHWDGYAIVSPWLERVNYTPLV